MRYRQGPDNKLYPIDEWNKRFGELTNDVLFYVMEDIKPFKMVAGGSAGKWVTSRSHKREYEKRHQLIEVGNEREEFTRYGGKTRYNPTRNWGTK